jgi:uncharacterized protein (DUF1697 family)
MTVYIALLRGINVGGHHIIKMQELKGLFEKFGLENVKTYIQSGNVGFQSDKQLDSLQSQIEKKIKNEFGSPVTVILRTASEWEEIIRHCPFSTESLLEGESVHLSLFENQLSQEMVARLEQLNSCTEECFIKSKEAYLYLRKSICHSKLATQLAKIGIPSTSRNWKTIKNLQQIL